MGRVCVDGRREIPPIVGLGKRRKRRVLSLTMVLFRRGWQGYRCATQGGIIK
jgi:hypothetical protein